MTDAIDQSATAYVLARFDGPRRVYLSAQAGGFSLMRCWSLADARLFSELDAVDRWIARVPVEVRVQLATFAVVEVALGEVEPVRTRALDGLALEEAEAEVAELERSRAERRKGRKPAPGLKGMGGTP